MREFIGLLDNISIYPKLKDGLIWKGDNSRIFSAEVYLNFLEGESPYSVPATMFWNPIVALKVGFSFGKPGGERLFTNT